MVRVDELEGLRGFLAVWVVVVHLLGAASVEPSSLGILEPLFGELIRVQIFCIMSGFVIFMMMSRRREPYLPYLSRRFLRIYPVYIFAFVLSVALSGIAYDALEAADFPGSKNADRIAIYEASFAMWPQHLLSHLTLLHGIVPNQWLPFGAYAFLGQGWNISTEFQFYVIASVLFWILHDARLTFKILMIAGIAAAWYVGMRWPNGAALSYFAIPIGLLYIVHRKRGELPFHWMFLLFATFIVACGMTHVMGIWTLWNADYWVSGGVKVVTAAASLATAFLLIPSLPRLVAMKSPLELSA